MPRSFNIPRDYRSDLVSGIKRRRSEGDQRKQDLAPSILNYGRVRFKLARFFGFCYGVENAIEIAYRAVEENPGRKIFLLSEMIHNPRVNQDLLARGVKFLQTADGVELISFDTLSAEDVVIVPAFGTTVEIFKQLEERGIEHKIYDATCPFVAKVWNRGADLAAQGYTVLIHGKHSHEETKATFSHIRQKTKSVVILDQKEAELLCQFISRKRPSGEFFELFKGRFSDGFNPDIDLERLAVVNQTTMLAEETYAISQIVREALIEAFGQEEISKHFADTRDTLCYATSENQRAMRSLVDEPAELALVVGGYNSSNTSHLVEICENRLPVYYIKDQDEILSLDRIRHLDLSLKRVIESEGWFPKDRQSVDILLSAGASCPDATVEKVMQRLVAMINPNSLKTGGEPEIL